MLSLRRHLLTGVLTAIPLWFTWLVLEFLLRVLADVGDPLVAALAAALRPRFPDFAEHLDGPRVKAAFAFVLALVGLTLLGWLATRVVGYRLLRAFDRMVEGIPLVKTIYGSTKKLITTFQSKPDGVQRIVLIDFPSESMKTVGLVTRTFEDAVTGRMLAAVYVPTTPNPTSGYLEIVPIDHVTPTEWTVDEAMEFIISGGAVAPDRIVYDRPADAPT